MMIVLNSEGGEAACHSGILSFSLYTFPSAHPSLTKEDKRALKAGETDAKAESERKQRDYREALKDLRCRPFPGQGGTA
jgi:hypothetical protein